MRITDKFSGLDFYGKVLVAILFFAIAVRAVGISYGLPLWLIDDEQPFILAAIKMLQLHTVIPGLHGPEFENILYYPPYISYLYLVPFAVLLGIQYIINHGIGDLLIPLIVSDLSQFFIAARLMMTAISLASIFLIYRTGKNIFADSRTGMLSAVFLSTSLLHILLSITSRHWLIVSFFGLLIFYILTNPGYGNGKKYLYASAAAGIGTGFSTIIAAYLALIALWYFFVEENPIPAGKIAACAALFSVLAAIPLLIYPQSLGFSGDVTTGASKTAAGILASPFLFLKPIAVSEPVMAVFAVIGLTSLFFARRNLLLTLSAFIYGYSALFYAAFRYEHRFTAGILPLIAILAAYGLDKSSELLRDRKIYLILAIPLIFSMQLGRLILNNDSRVIARTWIEENIPAHEKILVYARLTRLSADAGAIEEQRAVDSGSLRKVDEAEMKLPPELRGSPSFHALNLYSIDNLEFFENISEYSVKNGYRYLLISDEDFVWGRRDFSLMQEFAGTGKLMRKFGSDNPGYSISMTQIAGNPLKLFNMEGFGPPLSLYRISD